MTDDHDASIEGEAALLSPPVQVELLVPATDGA